MEFGGRSGLAAGARPGYRTSTSLNCFTSLLSPPPTGPISFLARGGAHVLALTSGGKVLTRGRGTSGRLGHGDVVNSPDPMVVMSLNNFFITHVSAGWNHSGFVSDAGDLCTCGDGSFGQLGHGDFQSQCRPVKVSFFVDKHVEQIACGVRYSLVLLKGVSGDEVYGFGSGKRDQLGISKAEGHLYTWGRGFGGTFSTHCPQRLPKSFSFTRVAVRWNHALVLTCAEVLMLGGNHHGVLSSPEKMTPVKHLAESKEVVVEKIPGHGARRIVQIAAGAEHSAIVTEDGVIKTWGWGEHGQLGLGNTDAKRVLKK